MLSSPTPFPCAGADADVIIRTDRPGGRRAATVLRRCRIQQVCRDGRYLVTAPARACRIGNAMVTVPAIQRTVTRADLRKPRRSGAGA